MNRQMFDAVVDPSVDADAWWPHIKAAADEFQIVDVQECSAWLANAAHESAHFTKFVEGLNYRWDALLKQWPKRFDPKTAIAVGRVDKLETRPGALGVTWNGTFYPTTKHAANQEQIANIAYGNRMGNTKPGDGWKFRGRGLFQLTFYSNYLNYSSYVKQPVIMEQPELVALPEHAARSAGWFWKVDRKLHDVLMQRGCEAACVAINGGTNGLQERLALFEKLQSLA